MSRSSSDPHILHVLRTFGFGGMERNALRVMRALAARGLRQSIALVSSEEDILDAGDAARVHRITPARASTSIELATLIRELSPTVIHVRNLSLWPEAAIARRMTARRVPLLVSYHGSESLHPAAVHRRMLFRVLAHDATRIFAVSEGARRSASALYGLPIERVEVIKNGVDSARFSPREIVRSIVDPVIIGNVGRLHAIKNLQLLIRAAAELVRRGLDIELRIAGNGPEEETLRALARTLCIEGRLKIYGRIEDVPAFLRELDVFALSSDLEGHPTALLEAMSCGLPCVATNVGGVAELIEHGRNGVLIPPKNELALIGALERLVRDPTLREQLGARAREDAVARFHESGMFDAYEAIYRGQRKPERRTPAGSYEIVRAERADERNILRMLQRYVTPRGAARRYTWLYRANPQGPAATWLALEKSSGEIVGLTSIFTRAFLVDGARELGSVGVDAFVRPDHRRRGIAEMLHAATKESMERRDVDPRFMCGPPVVANLSALLKTGSSLVGSAAYLHLPLAPHAFVSMLPLREDRIARITRFVDPLEAFLKAAWRRAASAVRVRACRFEQSAAALERLWEEVAPSQGIMGVRDARYVGWRYFMNPVSAQTVLALEKHDQLRGWAVVEHSERGCLLVDHLFSEDPAERGELLRALIAHVFGEGASKLSVFLHQGASANRLFTRHGFLAGRTPSQFQVMCGDDRLRTKLNDPAAWYLRAGDLDPESCRWSIAATPGVWTNPDFRSTRPLKQPFRRARAP